MCPVGEFWVSFTPTYPKADIPDGLEWIEQQLSQLKVGQKATYCVPKNRWYKCRKSWIEMKKASNKGSYIRTDFHAGSTSEFIAPLQMGSALSEHLTEADCKFANALQRYPNSTNVLVVHIEDRDLSFELEEYSIAGDNPFRGVHLQQFSHVHEVYAIAQKKVYHLSPMLSGIS